MQPILDAEIAAKELEIKSYIVHTSRAEYIVIVQPLKDELKALKEQNEIIKAANKAELDAIPPTAEELEKKRKTDIAAEIALVYSVADELTIHRQILQKTLGPTDAKYIEWLGVIGAAKLKYTKV